MLCNQPIPRFFTQPVSASTAFAQRHTAALGVEFARDVAHLSGFQCWRTPMNKALRVPDYLGHILEAIERIEAYVSDLDETAFLASRLVQDAVIRNKV
jgi:hypothetical protein